MQDQAISIVSELCEANKLKQIPKEVQSTCCLLLQIMEMALYLELCVLQICGMRPVLGRVEDFSKEVKKLMRGNDLFVPNVIFSFFVPLLFMAEDGNDK